MFNSKLNVGLTSRNNSPMRTPTPDYSPTQKKEFKFDSLSLPKNRKK